MGKKTLYHPISLNVIKGGFEYGGFTIGKIKQIENSVEEGTARYDVPLQLNPTEIGKINLGGLLRALNGCFAADVHVDGIKLDLRSGVCHLNVSTKAQQHQTTFAAVDGQLE